MWVSITNFEIIKATTTDKSDEESSLNSEFGCAKDPIIALLSEYCHSKVLNIDYLLGQSSQPFSTKKAKNKQNTTHQATSLKNQRKHNDKSQSRSPLQINTTASSPPSSSTSLTVSDASSVLSSPILPKSGSVSPRTGLFPKSKLKSVSFYRLGATSLLDMRKFEGPSVH